MPLARRVCTGWVDSESGERHRCGKVLGYTEVPDGGDSHGMCEDCFREQLASAHYTQEQIEQALRDAKLGQ